MSAKAKDSVDGEKSETDSPVLNLPTEFPPERLDAVADILARVLAAFLIQLRDGIFAPVFMHAVRRVALETFEQLHRLSLRFHLERKTGGLTRVLERGRSGIEEIVRLGLSVVLDFGFAARVERDRVRSVARGLGVGVELHFLDVSVDELWRRIEARNSKPPWDSAPIRRTHLDELPQSLNILRGDLSIVGPRPEQPKYVTELSGKIPFYNLRHLVRPGLTGWAQVKYPYGSTEADAMQKLQYEFYYLRHQGLALDARIIGRTLRTVIGREGR